MSVSTDTPAFQEVVFQESHITTHVMFVAFLNSHLVLDASNEVVDSRDIRRDIARVQEEPFFIGFYYFDTLSATFLTDMGLAKAVSNDRFNASCTYYPGATICPLRDLLDNPQLRDIARRMLDEGHTRAICPPRGGLAPYDPDHDHVVDMNGPAGAHTAPSP